MTSEGASGAVSDSAANTTASGSDGDVECFLIPDIHPTRLVDRGDSVACEPEEKQFVLLVILSSNHRKSRGTVSGPKKLSYQP